jgi:hypothetical protein
MPFGAVPLALVSNPFLAVLMVVAELGHSLSANILIWHRIFLLV